MYLWIDGTQYLDLKAAATTAPQSRLYPMLKATLVQLPVAGHQIHLAGSSKSASDVFTFGGFKSVYLGVYSWLAQLSQCGDGCVRNVEYALGDPSIQ